jgi:predicted aldo/keto reductase-like oxidoreductase
MEKRRLGRTGHLSTVAIFGAAAFWDVDQSEADQIMELVISHGINHIIVFSWVVKQWSAVRKVRPWKCTSP